MQQKQRLGVFTSNIDGRLALSSGSRQLDAILGADGLPLGSTLLIEENGTTDFAGSICRTFAACGLASNHYLYVVHPDPEGWLASLPQCSIEAATTQNTSNIPVQTSAEDSPRDGNIRRSSLERSKPAMRIAWRYGALEKIGQNQVSDQQSSAPRYKLDFTKKLSADAFRPQILLYRGFQRHNQLESLLNDIVQDLQKAIRSDIPSGSVLRIVVPAFLTPGLYPPANDEESAKSSIILWAWNLQRAIWRSSQGCGAAEDSENCNIGRSMANQSLANHARHAISRSGPQTRNHMAQRRSDAGADTCVSGVGMITVSTAVHSHESDYLRWVEHCMDGVIELCPFPPREWSKEMSADRFDGQQGLVKMWKYMDPPPFSSSTYRTRSGARDYAFRQTRKQFFIEPFSLPPLDEEDIDPSNSGSSSIQSERSELGSLDDF